jgi:hypothetical protein
MQATIVMMAAGQPMQKISPAIVDPTIIPIIAGPASSALNINNSLAQVLH